MAERDITLRVAIRNADEAIRQLKKLGADGEEALDRLGVGSKRASASLNQVTTESNRAARQGQQQLSNAGAQIQDFVVQISSGTNAMQALGQQLPQFLSAFNFGPVGIAAGIAAAAVGGLAVALVDFKKLAADLGLRSMADQASDAAKKVDELEGRTDKLATALGVVRDGAAGYTASLSNLSDAQRGLFTANIAAQLDAQTEALKKAKDAIGEAISNAGKASVGTAPALLEAQGFDLDALTKGAPEGALALRQRFEDLSRAFLEGGRDASRVREEIISLAEQSGLTEEKARELANAFITQASAAESARLASEKLNAELRLSTDPNDQAALAVINRSKALRDSVSAAQAYNQTLEQLKERTAAATSEEDKFVQRAKERAQIDKLGPVGEDPATKAERARIQAEAAAAVEAAARPQFRAEQQLDLEKRRADFAQQLAAREKELTGAVDERTRAGERAAAQARAQVGDAPKLIEQARQQAYAEYDRGKAIEAGNKAATAAGRQTEFLQRKEDEAAAAKREADAIRGTAQETEHALRYLKAENEFRQAGLNVQDASIRKRIEESVATAELVASLKAEQKAREDVAEATKLEERRSQVIGSAPADAISLEAIKGAYNEAVARGDSAFSFQDAQERVAAFTAIEDKLKDITDPTIREELRRQNIALYEQGKASGAAAKGLDALADVKRGAEQERQLSDALKQGLEVYKLRKREIEAENEVREHAIGLTEAEREELKRSLLDQKTVSEANDKTVKEMEDAAKRSAEAFRDVFEQPFKDLTSTISGVARDTILEFEDSGELSGQAFAQRFAEGIKGLGANLAGTLLSAPINAAVSGLTQQLTAAMTKAATANGLMAGNTVARGQAGNAGAAGSGFFGQLSAVGQWANASPLNAGLAGAAGGGLIGSVGGALMGRPNSYASTGGALGGAAGAALGSVFPVVGTAIGGLLGSVGGSLLGGMFGGGDDNSGDNNMRQRFRPGQGVYYRESVQEGGEQNAQTVNQFMDQLMKAGKIFEQAGLVVNENFGAGIDLKVGNNSGITLDGKKYSSIEDALGAALQQLGKRGYRAEGESITEQVARNTKATTAEGLAADFAFAKEYPRLIKGGGDLGRSIDEVAERFESLKDKAAELGLSVSKLDAVQDEQIHAMKEEARARIGMLTGESSEYRQALLNLGATFEKAKQDAKDLGMSTEKLNAARDKEREKLEAEANLRVDMLSGKGGDYLQAQIDLNAKYDEAKKIAIDLGRSTDDLNKARDRERDQLEDAAKESIRRLTGDFGSLDEAMLNLNKTFEDAKQLANQLGASTEKLNAARDHEREKLRATANADLRVLMGEWDPLAQQILQLRNVFEAANENARDLGYTEERLIEARKRATAELIENRRREAEDAVASQAEQFRSFFSSILDPLKQAQSAFGGLQGIVAPSASIDAGLAEFRDLAGRARQDDLSAIQQLPQLGQQLIQYARQYGASGAPANDIIREVQAAYAELETRYRDRQLEIMQSIPDAVIRTGADQIKAMQSEMNKVVEQLRVIEKTIRANKSGLLTAA